jgi:hypothetical protein
MLAGIRLSISGFARSDFCVEAGAARRCWPRGDGLAGAINDYWLPSVQWRSEVRRYKIARLRSGALPGPT